ncbi:MAG: transcriptional repressor [Clostridia bacterium]|nr:transcriptional repressor [Clostridia bacterium]
MKTNRSVQRDTVYDVLRGTKSHPTAEWIYEECRRRMPNISKGTVYRNLALLVKRGDVIKVSGDFESAHYDADVSLHAHAVCSVCGAVDDCTVSKQLQDALLKEKESGGYSGYGVTFNHVCERCRASILDIKQ